MANVTAQAQSTSIDFGDDAFYWPLVTGATVATTYYTGALIGRRSDGYAGKMDDTAAKDFLGIVDGPPVEVGASDGVKLIRLRRPRFIELPCDSTLSRATSYGLPLYSAYDGTCSITPGTYSNIIGYVADVVNADPATLTGTIARIAPVYYDQATGSDYTSAITFDVTPGPITGKAGAAGVAGGTITITGGTPASGNAAGGPITVTGGAGIGTGAGGATSVTGGASGAGATGNGGATSIVGGAALSTNGSGGAAAVTGGVATGTGTGGTVTITGGASGGASGTGGDVSIASGAAAGGTVGAVQVQTVSAGKLGFFGVTPVVRPTAYTQTYATADKTHAAPTAAALTVADGVGTNDGTIGAITGDASVIAAVQELAAQINKLIADDADTKQLLNSVIDDLQALGILQ